MKITAKKRRGKAELEEEKVAKAHEEGFKRTYVELDERLRDSHIDIRAVPNMVREHAQMLELLKARGVIDETGQLKP